MNSLLEAPATVCICMCSGGIKPSPSASRTPFPHPDSDEIPNVGCPGHSGNEAEEENDDEIEHLLRSYYIPGPGLMAWQGGIRHVVSCVALTMGWWLVRILAEGCITGGDPSFSWWDRADFTGELALDLALVGWAMHVIIHSFSLSLSQPTQIKSLLCVGHLAKPWAYKGGQTWSMHSHTQCNGGGGHENAS